LILGVALIGPLEALAIFQYTDEAGTVHFTDDPGQIPEPIRKRMGIWVEQPEPSPQADPNLVLRLADPALAQDPVKPVTEEPSRWEWIVPSGIPSPWMPGLIGITTAGVLLVGLRLSHRPVPRVAFKVVVAVVMSLSVAATVKALLDERGSSLASMVDEAGTAVDRMKSRVEAPLKNADRRAKEFTKAKHEYQEMIKQLESEP
jgi:hypothetical protein